MMVGTLVMVFILVLLASLALPALRLIMGLACLVLLAVFLADVLLYGGTLTGMVVDQLVIFTQKLWVAFDQIENSLPR